MKTKIFLFAALASIFGFTLNSKAQNIFPATGSAGIGTAAPDASAILEMKSTTQGMLVPRMTQAQRNAIAAPAAGLLVYQTKGGAAGFWYYDGAAWKQLAPKSANQDLSNLSTITAINTDLSSGLDNSFDLGYNTNNWKNLYLGGSIYWGTVRKFYVTDSNTAVGQNALINNLTGLENTALGKSSLAKNNYGIGNTAIGFSALSTTNSTGGGIINGVYNTAVGDNAGYGNTTGSYNVAIGNLTELADSSSSPVQSYSTTLVGYGALVTRGGVAGGVLYGTAIGSGARLYGDNATALGSEAIATASNQVMLGNTSVTSVKAAGSFVIYSDGRFKKNIKSNVPGLDFINGLQPVTYNYDIHKLNDFIKPVVESNTSKNQSSQDERNKQLNEDAINNKEKKIYSGFIAQDVEKTAEKLGYDFSGVYKPQNDKDPYGLSYADFVVPLVKAVQELSKMNNEKDAKINDLETRLIQIEEQLSKQNNIVKQQISSSAKATVSNASLEQNIPNPFTHSATINYTLPQTYSSAKIIITDKTGKALKEVNASGSGKGSVNIDASALANGAYSYSLYVNGKLIDTKQMLLVK